MSCIDIPSIIPVVVQFEFPVVGQFEKKPKLSRSPKIHTRRMASSANGALLYQPRAKPWVTDRATAQGLKARPIRSHGLPLRTVSCQIDPLPNFQRASASGQTVE